MMWLINNSNFLVLPLMALAGVALATDDTNYHSSSDEIPRNGYDDIPTPIFKFTDSNGKVSYSTSVLTSIANDFVQFEEVMISLPPSQQRVDESNLRHDEMKLAADKLREERAQRDVKREQEELKRLQRLALINQSKPPVVYREYIYSTNPHRLRKHKHRGVSAHHLANQPLRSRSRLPLPRSSFPAMFDR